MRKLFVATLSVAAVMLGGVAFSSAAGAQDDPECQTIVEIAAGNPDFSTLVTAVTEAGLVETLNGDGPFTVFAPTNAAFAKLPKAAVDDLLKPENKDKLAQILTCHVVAVDAHSPAIGKMIMDDGGKHPVKTVGGCTLTASIGANNELMLTDENGTMATVTIPDVEQSNGVIHVIDTVLMPKM